MGLFREFGLQEVLVILLIVVLLFGATKLPDLARNMGKSFRIFRNEIKSGDEDIDETKPSDETNPPSAATGRKDA